MPESAPKERRKYKSPPAVEAIAQLTFTLPISWDVRTAGQLFERLQDLYPLEPQARNQISADFTKPDQNPSNPNLGVALTSGPAQILFYKEDKSEFIMISPNTLSSHKTPPYDAWEPLEARLFEAYDRIKDLLPNQPNLAHCAVRYINKMDVPETSIEITDYLKIDFITPSRFPKSAKSYFYRSEMEFEDKQSKLAFTFGTVDSVPESSSFVFDFDLSASRATSFSPELAKEILNELKNRERELFESLITNKSREIFDDSAN